MLREEIMMYHTKYALVLKNGEIINPESDYIQSDTGEIYKTEHYFYWEGYGFNGSFPDIHSAWECIGKKNISGIYLTPTFGVKAGRYIPIEEVQRVIPFKKEDEKEKPKNRFNMLIVD